MRKLQEINDTFCVFDLETTGIDVTTAHVVTGAFLVIVRGEVKTRTWIANPAIDIPVEASNIHGVTTEIARRDGENPVKVLTEIRECMDWAWSQGLPLTIYNAAYDMSVMHYQMELYGIEPQKRGFVECGPIFDAYLIDKTFIDPYRRGKRTLVDVCTHYGVKLEGAHNAAGDCLMTARLAWKLLRHPKEINVSSGKKLIGDLTVSEMHNEQIEAYKTWAESYSKYKGEPIDPRWPVKANRELQGAQ